MSIVLLKDSKLAKLLISVTLPVFFVLVGSLSGLPGLPDAGSALAQGASDEAFLTVLSEARQREIGIQIEYKDQVCFIRSIQKGSISQKSGLRVGDKLLTAKIEADELLIDLERDGKVSTFSLLISVGLPGENQPSNQSAPDLFGSASSHDMRLSRNGFRKPIDLDEAVQMKRLGNNSFALNAERNALQGQTNQRLNRQAMMPLAAPQRPLAGNLNSLPPLAASANRQNPLTGNANEQTFNMGSPKLDISAFQNPPLSGAVNKIQLLADYDIELILDSSMSMRQADCPARLSRWSWCGVQAHQLARQLAPFVRKGFTITTFAGDYDVYENASPGNITYLFQNTRLSMGTRMAEPLQDRLGAFFNRRSTSTKPLLVAVISDGVPVPAYEPRMVAEVLVAASKRMKNPNEVTVVFFQIGSSNYRGKQFLYDLDNKLVGYGARYDLVKTVSFERLVQIGLAQALVDSINDFASKNKGQTTP